MNTLKQKDEIRQQLKSTTIVLVSLFILNKLFHKQLFELSTEISYQLQSNFELEKFSYFFSTLMFYGLFFLQQFWIFIFKNKREAIFYSLSLYLFVSFTSLMKMIMGEHRPSFLDERLIEKNKHFCENDYGMPSSHTFLVVLICCYTIEQLDKNVHFISERMSYWVNLSILIVIAFTRVYLGVHSIMQIFIGGFLALELYLLGEMFKDKVIENVINPILNKDEQSKRILKIVSIGLILYLLIATFLFVNLRNWEKSQNDFFNKIIHCKQVLDQPFNFSGKDFGQVLMIAYFYGFFLGLYQFPGNFLEFSNFYIDEFNFEYCKKLLLAIVTQGINFYNIPKVFKSNDNWINPLRSLVIHFFFPYIMLRFGPNILKALKINNINGITTKPKIL